MNILYDHKNAISKENGEFFTLLRNNKDLFFDGSCLFSIGDQPTVNTWIFSFIHKLEGFDCLTDINWWCWCSNVCVTCLSTNYSIINPSVDIMARDSGKIFDFAGAKQGII